MDKDTVYEIKIKISITIDRIITEYRKNFVCVFFILKEFVSRGQRLCCHQLFQKFSVSKDP